MTHWALAAAKALRKLAVSLPEKAGPLGAEHLLYMIDKMDESMSVGKLNRWLGWIQASLVGAGFASLDFMKTHNKFFSNEQKALEKDDRRPIPEHHSANFETLKRAFADDSVALMTCGSKLGTRTVICMVNRNTDGSMTFIPVGEMCEAENPFQHYTPPFPGEEDGS